jgi:ubiquinone/menaquinone biosynthesis C-methylase UbiE
MNFSESLHLSLDVGCGFFPKGDVNVDLNVEPSGHRLETTALPVKCIPNFVKADAHYLPFPSNTFGVVYSSHMIEHVPQPERCLDEMVRVTKFRVKLNFPHWLGERKSASHLHHFKVRWFIAYAKSRGLCIIKNVSDWKHFPNEFFSIIRVPRENDITLLKPH